MQAKDMISWLCVLITEEETFKLSALRQNEEYLTPLKTTH